MLKAHETDIVVMDISMPVMDGIEALKYIKQKYPSVKVLMLTFSNDADKIKMAMQNHAHGYLIKNRGGKEIVKAIKTLMKGEYYFPDDIQKIVFESHIPKEFLEDELKQRTLTQREEEIISLLTAGLIVPEIAKKLHRSEKTIEGHKSSLMKKLGARNVQDVVRFGQKNG